MNRRGQKILSFGTVAIAACLILFATRSGPLSLSLEITETGMSQEGTAFAFIAITNAGSAPVKWGYNGCWLEAQTPSGGVTNSLGRGGIVEPRGRDVFSVRLPPDTQNWRLRCVVSEASTRQRVSFWLRQNWEGNIRRVGRAILPDNEGKRQTVWSPVFSCENFVEVRSSGRATESDATSITDLVFDGYPLNPPPL